MPETAWLQCVACSARFEIGPMFFGCPACKALGRAAPVEVTYDLDAVAADLGGNNTPGLWRWSPLLPPVKEASRISLAEGRTPMIPVRNAPADVQVLVKNETANPTWSWKDRPNCVSASMAREFGFKRTAAISTGNHGCAASAYSSAAGMNCVIFCHAEAPAAQLALMSAYGARVIRGGNQEALFAQLLRRGDYFPCSIFCPRPGYANPYGIEGFKTIAFEIYEQLGNSAPDRVFVPTGSGDGIYGVWKGFRELLELGLIPKAPKMIACQAAGADSAFRAFRRGSHQAELLETASTVALSIAERITGDHALRAVYQSGGTVLTSTDDETLKATQSLTRQGLAIEPASAVTLACLRQLPIAPGETWVMIGSGSAAKWGTMAASFQMPRCHASDFANLDELSLD